MTEALAKLRWIDPHTRQICEYVLTEGATATIGRSSNNDVVIMEQHVSRQHAVISYRDGVFLVNDLGSANGTFVNDNKINAPFPLFAGDIIRLFVPTIEFLAADNDDVQRATESGRIITATAFTGQGSLVITNGLQEGQVIPLLLPSLTIGRATQNATWEILIQDPSISRPHARLERRDEGWFIYDLASSNGTLVNTEQVTTSGLALKDGDKLTLGATVLLFRATLTRASQTSEFASGG
ncbi:MAG: FHA domain-containing protein [Anaerolineae bacterium]|nr:FHA domain-containing protein [Anaerolineae bacterium]MDW8173470.1 FHA domain-containing protein [Anaerolineae bacterium]